MPVTDANATHPARRLAAALEPVVGQVYFAPECHAGYEALGFAASSRSAGKVELPDGPAYFTSRGSLMGQVPGEVVAAAFAVFNPAVVVPAVQLGWTLTDARTICAARDAGAVAQLRRVLGEAPEGVRAVGDLLWRIAEPLRPEGRALYGGVLSQAIPDDPLGRMWRAGDLLREYRGDSHTAAWVSAGLDAVEIGLLSELWVGLGMKTYVRTRAWSDGQLDDGIERLRSRGLLDDDRFSEQGRALRASVEDATDRQVQPGLSLLHDEELEDLLRHLKRWGAALREAGAYLAAGPGDLARPVP